MKGKVNEISGFEAEEIQPDVQYKDALKKMSSLGSIINLEELQSIMYDLGSNHKSYSNIKEIQKAARRSADLTRQLLAFA